MNRDGDRRDYGIDKMSQRWYWGTVHAHKDDWQDDDTITNARKLIDWDIYMYLEVDTFCWIWTRLLPTLLTACTLYLFLGISVWDCLDNRMIISSGYSNFLEYIFLGKETVQIKRESKLLVSSIYHLRYLSNRLVLTKHLRKPTFAGTIR